MSHLYDQLPDAGKRLARIPRFGRLIGRMRDERLDRLDSNAAVYWEVLTYVSLKHSETTGLLDTGLKSEGARLLGWHDDPALLSQPGKPVPVRTRKWQCRLALNFLSAVAFHMMRGEDSNGNPAPMDHIDSQDVESFEDTVRDSMFASGTYVDETGRQSLPDRMWNRDWECIKNLNAGLEYNLFSDCESKILFTDNNFRDFLAAHWAVRWASPEEQWLTQDWMPNCLDDKRDYDEFWNRVIEIRELPILPKEKLTPFNKEAWESLIAPIYDIQLQQNPLKPFRSTKLIYRTWDRMEEHDSKRAFQNEFANLTKTSKEAQRLIEQEDGTSQFIQLANPNAPLEKEQFCDVDGTETELAEIQMGSSDDDAEFSDEKPRHLVLLIRFAMHRFCLTNAQFELFAPRHHAKREFAGEVDSVDQHPVVNVDWYDAWVFANWIGWIEIGGVPHRVQLPSEAQWEYACRCGETTSFTWSDRQRGDQIRSGDANFDGNYPWPTSAESSEHSIYLGRTISVHGDDADLKLAANPWGLHQMHGNVWEWCSDWYDADYYRSVRNQAIDPTGPNHGSARVLRGGGWIFSDGGGLRSAYRGRFTPSVRYRGGGFRLAAVPLSQASQAEQAEA